MLYMISRACALTFAYVCKGSVGCPGATGGRSEGGLGCVSGDGTAQGTEGLRPEFHSCEWSICPGLIKGEFGLFPCFGRGFPLKQGGYCSPWKSAGFSGYHLRWKGRTWGKHTHTEIIFRNWGLLGKSNLPEGHWEKHFPVLAQSQGHKATETQGSLSENHGFQSFQVQKNPNRALSSATLSRKVEDCISYPC